MTALGQPVHAIPGALIARRLSFERLASTWGYRTLADVGFEGPWVSPIQMVSGHPDGPVLLGKDYLDAPSLIRLRDRIAPQGYLPDNPFNKVIDAALAMAGMTRRDVYITQCFAAIVPRHRSTAIPIVHYRASFEAVGRHELAGRRVLALGPQAQRLCAEFGIAARLVAHHPSARGPGLTVQAKAAALAEALAEV